VVAAVGSSDSWQCKDLNSSRTTQRIEGERNIVIAPEGLTQPGEEAYRYRLKAPVFTGLKDVEQFIQEFSEVIDITQWPPWVALIQLRMALTEQTKPYGLGASVDGIFTVLQARFGISVVGTRARLQGLRREAHTPSKTTLLR